MSFKMVYNALFLKPYQAGQAWPNEAGNSEILRSISTIHLLAFSTLAQK